MDRLLLLLMLLLQNLHAIDMHLQHAHPQYVWLHRSQCVCIRRNCRHIVAVGMYPQREQLQHVFSHSAYKCMHTNTVRYVPCLVEIGCKVLHTQTVHRNCKSVHAQSWTCPQTKQTCPADTLDLSMCCLQAKAGITDDIIEVLTTTSAELSKGRRKRPMPAGLASAGTIEQYGLLSSHPLHKTSEVSFIPTIF